MQTLQRAMDDLNTRLHAAETAKSKWPPVSEFVLDQLPDQVDELKVCFFFILFIYILLVICFGILMLFTCFLFPDIYVTISMYSRYTL